MQQRNFDRERDEATIRLVRTPSDWPIWPFLPLKSVTEKDKTIPGFPRCGYLCDDEDFRAGRLKVREGVVPFAMKAATDPVILEVDSAESLLARGWVVD